MAKRIKQIEVSKETDEVLQAVVSILKATKAAIADGFQPGQDLPAVVAAAWAALPVAIAGFGEIGAEAHEDRHAFISALSSGVADMADALLPAQA